jgi:hypothetical protein
MSSISEKEAKELKDLKQSKHVDQYLNKFPENEKFLGFENVSRFILPIFFIAFQHLLREFSYPNLVPLSPLP